jgi:hypothetical protein
MGCKCCWRNNPAELEKKLTHVDTVYKPTIFCISTVSGGASEKQEKISDFFTV